MAGSLPEGHRASLWLFKGKFQYMARPIEDHNLELISIRVATCLILHNMCVSDRVLKGDVYATYDPAATLEKNDNTIFPVTVTEFRETQKF